MAKGGGRSHSHSVLELAVKADGPWGPLSLGQQGALQLLTRGSAAAGEVAGDLETVQCTHAALPQKDLCPAR